MSARVYAAISAVTRALAKNGIPKDRLSLDEGYTYRSIDDVMVRLAPLLAKHRLCVLPRVLDREVSERQGLAGDLLVNVALRVAYDLVSAQDGSSHTIEAYGEALDASDKATAKAMQSAYKYALLQAFAVPVSGSGDADASSPRLKQPALPAEPVQGWSQWYEDISELINGCDSVEAVDRVQQVHRATLAALQREQVELYSNLGKTVAAKRAALGSRPNEPRRLNSTLLRTPEPVSA